MYIYRIGHDNQGGSKRWRLSWVEVKVDDLSQRFNGDDRWIDESNGLEVELLPKTDKQIGKR